MKIKSIKIKNYLSYGSDEQTYETNDGINFIVGENNNGKSNLISVYSVVRDCLLQKQISYETIHKSKPEGNLSLYVDFIFDQKQIYAMMAFLNFCPVQIEEYYKIFGDQLSISVTKTSAKPAGLKFRLGELYIKEDLASSNESRLDDTSLTPTKWKNIVKTRTDGTKVAEDIQKELRNSMLIQFSSNFRDFVANIFFRKVVSFPEYRNRPGNTSPMDDLVPTGSELAVKLFNMKNGELFERALFSKIQGNFTKIFPHLKLEVRNGPVIVLVQNGYEVTQNAVGAGVIEILNMLAYLTDSDDMIFLIDEPESHLHPHGERIISNLMKEASSKNQIICVTHSPRFLNLESLDQIKMVRYINSESKLFSPIRTKPVPNKYLRIMETDQKELFFSRAVLLVEGETEFGVMPLLSKKNDTDFDLNGISVITIGGNDFETFVKLLNTYSIPFTAMTDRDTLIRISGSVKNNSTHNDIKTSSLFIQLEKLGLLNASILSKLTQFENEIEVKSGKSVYKKSVEKDLRCLIPQQFKVLSSDFEGVLRGAGLKAELEEAGKKFPRSKVLQGRYVAISMQSLPEELKTVTDQVVKISRSSIEGGDVVEQ